MKFSVIVPVLNSRPYLTPCLDSILRAIRRCSEAELVVIDNGSTDGSLELIRSKYSEVARIERATGITVGALRNLAVGLTDGDVLVFIDSDCTVAEDYFRKVREVLERTGADATGSKVTLPDQPTWVEKVWYTMHQTEREGATNYINSGNLVVRRAAFNAVGGFNEKLITGEDSELGFRLNSLKYRVYAAPSVAAVHLANDKTLAVFFRKHVWRGLGMFGATTRPFTSKPVLTTLAHLAFITTGVIQLVLGSWPLVLRGGVLFVLASLIPASAVAYRTFSTGRSVPFLRGVVLYHLFFIARVISLGKLIARRVNGGTQTSFRPTGRHTEA